MDNTKKLISWNVNGLRAVMKKNFFEFLEEENPDILCLQETKMQEGQAEVPMPGYHQYWCSAEKKGYSGVLLLSKEQPIAVSYGIGIEEHDKEGRVITAEYDSFYLVNIYTPNSGEKLARLEYRMEWEEAFRKYVSGLGKSAIICGDLNVAHKEIDLKNPKTNKKNAGFTPQEREKMSRLQESGFTDTFRYFFPDKEGAYSWWSYRFNARANNAGWRIDYFLVSKELEARLVKAEILSHVMGSDHCPVTLQIKCQ